MEKIGPAVELNGWWSFLLKTWLVAFPVVVSAIVGNFAWLNYETMQTKFHRDYVNHFINTQMGVNKQFELANEATKKMNIDILVSLGKIQTELELQRKK